MALCLIRSLECVKWDVTCILWEGPKERQWRWPVCGQQFELETTVSNGGLHHLYFPVLKTDKCRSEWLRCLSRGSAAARLLRLCVRIPPEAWMLFSCERYVLIGRGHWHELITRPEETYRVWCVVFCDLVTWRMRRHWPALAAASRKEKDREILEEKSWVQLYVEHLESKERLRIQPAHLFNFSWWVMWCVQ